MMALPADSPVTRPPEFTVATAVLLLVHVPPVVEALSVVVVPVQIVVVPVIDPAEGAPFTVTVATALFEPQVLVTV